MGIIKIDNKMIRDSLAGVRRQYLVGNLKLPQALEFIRSEDIEIGLSSYEVYTEELPHYHTSAVEYQYVISGWTKYMNTETGEEYEFKTGDFYAIESNTPYAQKCKSGTEILFIKVPSINDKVVVELNSRIEDWYREKLKTIREDFRHQENMPVANSVKPAAAVAVLDNGRVLMLKRKDNGKWTLPGGTLELDESLADCAVREINEECGLRVTITDILGTYTDPDIRIAYSDGEVRREFTIVYIGTVQNTNVVLDEESAAFQWVPLEQVQELPMAESQRERILDLMKYVETKERVFK